MTAPSKPTPGELAYMDARSRWSCDQRPGEACRESHGCHCREITSLSREVDELSRSAPTPPARVSEEDIARALMDGAFWRGAFDTSSSSAKRRVERDVWLRRARVVLALIYPDPARPDDGKTEGGAS